MKPSYPFSLTLLPLLCLYLQFFIFFSIHPLPQLFVSLFYFYFFYLKFYSVEASALPKRGAFYFLTYFWLTCLHSKHQNFDLFAVQKHQSFLFKALSLSFHFQFAIDCKLIMTFTSSARYFCEILPSYLCSPFCCLVV